MERKIVWTATAVEDLAKIINYLDEEWEREITDQFLQQLHKQLTLLKQFPRMGSASKINTEIRRFVLSEHNSVFYSITPSDSIVILNVFDNRRDPGF
jgi:plasmid stabilization system protein ParE